MEKMLNKLKKILKIFFQKSYGTSSIYKLSFGEENIAQQDRVMDWIARFVKHVIQKEKTFCAQKALDNIKLSLILNFNNNEII